MTLFFYVVQIWACNCSIFTINDFTQSTFCGTELSRSCDDDDNDDNDDDDDDHHSSHSYSAILCSQAVSLCSFCSDSEKVGGVA